MANKKNYQEGDWFAVPLNPDGFAVGLVARNARKGHVVLAYFVERKFSAVPSINELGRLQAEDARIAIKVGGLGLVNGEWIFVGRPSEWNRDKWPMPKFVRHEPISNRMWLVTYSDVDPSLVLSEELIAEKDAKGLERDRLFGYKAAEKRLSRDLENE